MAGKSNSNEILITRVYDAPIKLVWDAWNDPEQVAQWWGPRGFSLTTHSKDLKPRGHWSFTMHGPDGVDYPNWISYHKVEPCVCLVYDHGSDDASPPLFRVTVDFAEIEGKTKMDMVTTLPTPEAAMEIRKFIKKAGGESTWDRLAEFLERKTSAKDVFVINRSFRAPLATVFEAWINPKQLSQWLAPTGHSMEFFKADIREGGESHYMMTNGKITLYGKTQYIEIREPQRLVYLQRFCDEKGEISRHPLAPTWPETMKTTVNFAEEAPDQTRITVTWEVYGEATQAERDMFNGAKSGMTGGWTGSFDKMDEYLEIDPNLV